MGNLFLFLLKAVSLWKSLRAIYLFKGGSSVATAYLGWRHDNVKPQYSTFLTSLRKVQNSFVLWNSHDVYSARVIFGGPKMSKITLSFSFLSPYHIIIPQRSCSLFKNNKLLAREYPPLKRRGKSCQIRIPFPLVVRVFYVTFAIWSHRADKISFFSKNIPHYGRAAVLSLPKLQNAQLSNRLPS